MKHFFTFLSLVVFLAIIVVCGHIVSQYLPNSEDEIHHWQQRVDELEEEKKALQAEANRVPELEKALADSQEEAEKVPELEKELSDSKKKRKKLDKKTGTNLDGNELLKIYEKAIDSLFPATKIPYEMRDEDFKFYSDRSCDPAYLIKEPLTPVGFTDHLCKYYDDDGVAHEYYMSRCEQKKYNGGLVYSERQPIFYPIDDN